MAFSMCKLCSNSIVLQRQFLQICLLLYFLFRGSMSGVCRTVIAHCVCRRAVAGHSTGRHFV